MFRPTAARLALARPLSQAQTISRVVAPRPTRASQTLRVSKRTFAAQTATPPPPPPPPPPAQGGGGGFNPSWLVLGLLVGLGGAGYVYLKPVIDVAKKTSQAIDTTKQGANAASDSLASIAQAALPPGAFALYTALGGSNGIGGFINNLKDKDLQGVIDEVKKHGGEDAKRIIEKVEKKVKEANGQVSNVNWAGLAEELKAELPKDKQQMVDMFIGKLPGKEDFDAYIKKAQEMGQDSLKEVEKSAKKILDSVEKARKDGKSQADAFLSGLKQAAPADVDSLIKQLKDAAKSAGLPADQAEDWLKSKAQDGKINAEETGQQIVSKLRTVSKIIPGNPKDLTDQLAQLSPSLAKLFQQALQQADVVDEKGNRK